VVTYNKGACSRQSIHENVALIQGEGISSEEDLGEGFEADQDGPGQPIELTSRAYEELASKKRGARKKPSSTVADFAKVRSLTTKSPTDDMVVTNGPGRQIGGVEG
jgi:hypothetical protein